MPLHFPSDCLRSETFRISSNIEGLCASLIANPYIEVTFAGNRITESLRNDHYYYIWHGTVPCHPALCRANLSRNPTTLPSQPYL
jgi:hypothetical protein